MNREVDAASKEVWWLTVTWNPTKGFRP